MMFDALPDLTPRDSHILWYTSLRNPHLNNHHDTSHSDAINPSQQSQTNNPNHGGNNNNQNNRSGRVPLERTALGRLRADEAYMARRLANISNFGATWLKPPGVAKSLYQMREERREAEEHAEAVRREQLAAELAEAEAAQVAQAEGGMEEMMGEDGGDGDGEGMGMGEVDLDDEIPDADASGMGGFGYEDSSEEEEEEEDDDGDEDADRGENWDDGGRASEDAGIRQLRVQQREMASREDRLRELMARGGTDADAEDIYGVVPDEDLDEDTQGEILEEEDLVHEHDQHLQYDVEPGEDLDMDANLDDDIPEAESLGGYEHTDSDAELSSSEDESGLAGGQNVSFGAAGAGRGGGRMLPPLGQGQGRATTGYRRSLASNATRQSLDLSSILDSSTMGSSPQVRRRN